MTTQSKEEVWFHHILALINSRELDKASQELDALSEFRDVPEYDLLYCKILFDRSQLHEALGRIDEAILRYPSDWRLHELKCHIALKKRDANGLSGAFRQLELTSPPTERLWKFREEIAVLEEDFAKAIKLLETAVACGDLSVTKDIAYRLFLYSRRVGNFEEAFCWLAKCFEIDPEAAIDASLLINFLLEISPEDYGESKIEELRGRFPENNTILFAHIRLLLTTGKSEKIPAIIEDSSATIKENTRRSLRNLLSTTDIEVPSENSEASPEDRIDRSGPITQEAFVRCLIYEGPEKARNAFQYLANTSERETCSQLLALIPPASAHCRTLASSFPKNQGWLIAAGESSIGTVLVFTGMAGRVGVHNTFFDSYLAALNLDAIYLRDVRRDTYLGGISGLGGTAKEMAEKLVELSPSKPLYCVSFSGGSIGALSCCLNVNLKSAIMFSPYTYLFSNDRAHTSAMRYLQKRYKSVTSDFLVGFKSTGPEFPIHLIYGTEDEDCAHQVSRVAHVGNMPSHRVKGSTHSSLVYDLAFRGQLLPLLKNALSLG